LSRLSTKGRLPSLGVVFLFVLQENNTTTAAAVIKEWKNSLGIRKKLTCNGNLLKHIVLNNERKKATNCCWIDFALLGDLIVNI
jgi:hypothetical protein